MASAALEGFRLYGVAASEARHHDSLAAGTRVIEFRALSAVVAPAEYSRVEQTAGELDSYVKIIEEVYGHTPVLPAPPGTVFKSRETLLRWLELHYFTLLEALSHVEGHSAARVTLSARSRPADAEETKKLESVASESLRALRGQAAATVSHAKDEEDGNGELATASFLVEAARWDVFADTVADEAKRHPEMDYRITGPWPPYDFVQMKFGA